MVSGFVEGRADNLSIVTRTSVSRGQWIVLHITIRQSRKWKGDQAGSMAGCCIAAKTVAGWALRACICLRPASPGEA